MKPLAVLSLAIAASAVAAPAPPLAMTLADGRQITLADLHGEVVLLNLWATWCGPCKQEVPLLNAYAAAHRAQGLVVIGIALDSAPDGKGRWISRWIHYQQARSVRGAYGIRGGVPTSYVIGRDGTLRYARGGAFDRRMLARVVGPLL